MDFGQIVAISFPVIVALLGLWRAHLLSKGKKELAAVIDAVIDGIEVAGDVTTKQAVNSFASKAGVSSTLDKALDSKGYRSNGGPIWKTSLES